MTSPQPPSALPLEDLIHRLRSRAMIEAPQDNDGYDPESDADDSAEITWGELAEIVALLREAADALGALVPLPQSDVAWQREVFIAAIRTLREQCRVNAGGVASGSKYRQCQTVFMEQLDDALRIIDEPSGALVPLPATPTEGVRLIAAERERQKAVEGWTPEHDDSHMDAEMNEAARCYLSAAFLAERGRRWNGAPPPMWPWNQSWWKPSDDPIRNLAKAGALIAAEIDRLQRQNGVAFLPVQDEAPPDTPEKCPTCESPQPHLHPSMQPDGGEVQPCGDSWHKTTPTNWSLVSAPRPVVQDEAPKACPHCEDGIAEFETSGPAGTMTQTCQFCNGSGIAAALGASRPSPADTKEKLIAVCENCLRQTAMKISTCVACCGDVRCHVVVPFVAVPVAQDKALKAGEGWLKVVTSHRRIIATIERWFEGEASGRTSTTALLKSCRAALTESAEGLIGLAALLRKQWQCHDCLGWQGVTETSCHRCGQSRVASRPSPTQEDQP